MMTDLLCVTHEADPQAPPVKARAVILGLSVCTTCLSVILGNTLSGESYGAEDYLRDAAEGNWCA